MIVIRRPRRVIPKPVFVFATDARRAPGGPRDAPPDPGEERRSKIKGGAIFLLWVAVFSAGAIYTIFGKDGLLDSRRMRSQRATLEAQVEAQRNRVEMLRRQVEQLNDSPMARERIAREELDYARPGEVTFLLPDEAGSGAEQDGSGEKGEEP